MRSDPVKRKHDPEIRRVSLAPTGYSGTSLPKKLGFKDDQKILFIDLPENLAALKQSARFAEITATDAEKAEQITADFDVIHLFVTARAVLEDLAPWLRKAIVPDGMVWVSWPKKASKVPTDISEDTLREVLLPTGLVDVKVCAIDDVWSGLKFMIRKELRR